MRSEPTVGEIRKALADQPDNAVMKFIRGDERLRVLDAWPNLTSPEFVIQFEPPERT